MVLLRELSLATFLALAGSANAFYGKSSGVITLDSKNFEKEILNTEYASVRCPLLFWILSLLGC